MTAEPVNVRPARRADLDTLLALEQACFDGVYAAHRWQRAQFIYYLEHVSAPLAVAELASVGVVGYVAGFYSQRGAGLTARLYSIAVSPNVQRRGVGGRLLDWFIAGAIAAGCDDAVLEVAARLGTTRRWFERAGFEAMSRLPDYYAPGEHGHRLRRRLRDGAAAACTT